MEPVLRHVCTLCGGCCQGFQVPLYDEAERAQVVAAGQALGVADPIDGQALRRVDGACVFLGADDRCTIHATLGAQAKPTPCRQFPLVAVRAEDGLRVQVDPGSYGAWASWERGDPLPSARLVATRTPAAGGHTAVEARLLSSWERASGVDEIAAALLGAPTGAGSPWQARVARHLAVVPLDPWVQRDGAGRKLRAALGPLLAQAPGWSAGPPPGHADPELERWMVEAARRMIWLRLLPDLPSPAVAALLLAVGAVGARWVQGGTQVQADVWTGWLRALRFEPVWKTVARDAATLAWLAGRTPDPVTNGDGR